MKVFRYLLIILLLLPVLLISLLLSASVNRWGIEQLNASLEGLSINYQKGDIFNGYHFSSISYDNPSLSVSAHDISVALNWQCVWQGAICINRLDLQAIDITLAEASAPEASQAWYTSVYNLQYPPLSNWLPLSPYPLKSRGIKITRVCVSSAAAQSVPECLGEVSLSVNVHDTELKADLVFTHYQSAWFKQSLKHKLSVQQSQDIVQLNWQSTQNKQVWLSLNSELAPFSLSLPLNAELSIDRIPELAIQSEQLAYLDKLNLSLSGDLSHLTIDSSLMLTQPSGFKRVDLQSSITPKQNMAVQSKLIAIGAGGELTGKIEGQWQQNTPSAAPSGMLLNVALETKALNIYQIPWAQPWLAAPETLDLSALTFDLNAQSFPSLEVKLNAESLVDTQVRAISIDQFDIRLLDSFISLQGQLADNLDENSQLNYQIELANIGKVVKSLSGSGKASGSLKGLLLSPTIEGSLSLTQFTLEDIRLDQVNANYQLSLAEPFTHLIDITGNNWLLADHQLEQVTLQSEGKLNTLSLSLAIPKGDITADLALLASKESNTLWQGQLSEASIAYDKLNIALKHANKFTFNSEQSIASLPQQLWQVNYSLADEQALNADIRLEGTLSPNWIDVKSSVDIAQIIQAKAAINLDLRNQSIEQARIDLAPASLDKLTPYLPQLSQINGNLSGSFDVSGAFTQANINGELQISDAGFALRDHPLYMRGIQQTVNITNNQLALDGEFELGDGHADLSGQATLPTDWSIAASIRGENLSTAYQQHSLTFSPNIQLKASAQQAEITGSMIIPKAKIKITQLPENAKQPSPDVVILDQERDKAQQYGLFADLSVLIDPDKNGQVQLDALDLKTALSGDLKAIIKNSDAELFGNISMLDGSYQAYGQQLVIRKGDIYFSGAPQVPSLNIEAIRAPQLTQNDVIAGIRVEGTSRQPKINLFSEPAFNQATQLAYLLTGKDLGDDGQDFDQNVALVNALLSFGIGRSEVGIGRIGNTLGIRDLNLATSGQGDATQVKIQGQLAEGVTLAYGIGVFDAVTELSLRYQLLPSLYLQAVSGSHNAVDIFYEFTRDDKTPETTKD